MLTNWTVFETMFLIFGFAIGCFSKNKANDLITTLTVYSVFMIVRAILSIFIK